MKKIYIGLLVLAFLIVLSACGEEKQQASARAERAAPAGQAASPERSAPAPAADTVQYEMMTRQKTAGDCDPAEEGCTHIRLVYPKITRAAAKAALQQGVDAELLKPVFEAGAAAANSPDGLMAQFFTLYETTLNDDPASAMFGWAVERTIRVVYNTPRVFAIETGDYSFTGGAHPNSMTQYTNFDARTGKKLTLNDLFQPGYQQQLNRLAEQEFRRARQMGAGDTFESAGYWFENNQFRLPDNFFINEHGLSFFYNPYEIAPYAMGSSEVTLSRAALQSLLRPDGPLAAR